MMNRRQLLTAGAGLMATGAMAKTQNMGLPEAAMMDSPSTQAPLRPIPAKTITRWSRSTAGHCPIA